VTATPGELEIKVQSAESAIALNPYRNPSYPERDHFAEREQLAAVLRSCEERLGAALRKLEATEHDARRAELALIFHQMQGARDQIAEAVRRIPLEAGGLYREDKERFGQGVAAFERTWKRWEQGGA
jgi:hypothetical protein